MWEPKGAQCCFWYRKTQKGMIYSPLAYGAAWIQFTCQTSHPGTGQSNKAPLVHVPHHCAAPRAFHCTRNQSCCSLLYSDNCSRYRRGNRTCGKPLKNQTRNLSFSKTGASPSFPVALHPSIGSVALSPLPRLLNGRIAGMQIVLVMQLLMVRFTAEASHHFKPHNGSLGDGTLQN